jgi:membrane fusion protein, heavy metal efflux system
MLKHALATLSRRRWSAARGDPTSLAAVAILAVAIVAILVWAAWSFVASGVAVEPVEPPVAADAATHVRLSGAKLAAADLHASYAEYRELQETRRVPGTIGYNKARRLEVKMPVAGVVKQILARPGQAVKGGDRLAILTSTEVGLARDAVAKAEADAELARKESEWATQIAAHLEELLAALGARPAVEDVEKTFHDKILGNHREGVFSAYSKLLLAEKTSQSTDAVSQGGAISGLVVRERRSAREVAAAAFLSVSEQSRFEASQARARAQASLAHAERLVAVNRQNLAVLLGPFAKIAPSSDDRDICELILRAPVTGLIEDRFVAEGTQIVPSQPLFAIANTDTLWVSAQIYEREWAALGESKVEELVVESPAVPGAKVPAKMLFVSVSASPVTRAVPLVAELSNADGRFKPGMFAWVHVPVGGPHKGLSVPVSAVTRHEQRPFVFVEERPGTYRKVDVGLGFETPDYVEVTQGLKPGEKVIDRGVFVLKSELLLQGEKP